MTDFRNLCAELIDAIDSGIPTDRMHSSPLMLRARDALAESENHIDHPITHRRACLPMTEEFQTQELWISNQSQCVYQPLKVICPKHGPHPHTINSNIPGYQGTWCMLCALDQLGSPLPTTND
jgi:hypothetical protein